MNTPEVLCCTWYWYSGTGLRYSFCIYVFIDNIKKNNLIKLLVILTFLQFTVAQHDAETLVWTDAGHAGDRRQTLPQGTGVAQQIGMGFQIPRSSTFVILQVFFVEFTRVV